MENYTNGKLREWVNETNKRKENDLRSYGGVLAPVSAMLIPERGLTNPNVQRKLWANEIERIQNEIYDVRKPCMLQITVILIKMTDFDLVQWERKSQDTMTCINKRMK